MQQIEIPMRNYSVSQQILESVAETAFKPDWPDFAVWTILLIIFIVQDILCLRCLIHAFRMHKEISGHKCKFISTIIHLSPYLSLYTSISLSVFSAIFGILADLVNFPTNVAFDISQFTLETILGGFPVIFLYGSIVLFLRSRSRLKPTYSESSPEIVTEDSPNHVQTVIQSMIFAVVFVLYGGSTILQDLLQSNSITASGDIQIESQSISQAEYHEYNITFWAGYIFLVFATIDVFVSSSLALKRLKENGMEDRLTSFIFRIVAPLNCLNTVTTFILDIISDKNPELPDFIFDLFTNIFYVAAISILLYAVIPEQYKDSKDINKPINETSIVAATSKSSKHVVNPENDLNDSKSSKHSGNPEDDLNNSKCSKPNSSSEDDFHKLDESQRWEILLRYHKETKAAWLKLFSHYDKREESTENHDFQKDMLSDSQVFSTMSVLTVFLATISVALAGIAQTTYMSQSSGSGTDVFRVHLSTRDNVFSCFYLSTLISVMAACFSGLASAIRSLMARKIRKINLNPKHNNILDRALVIIFIFSCIMMAMGVVSLIFGLILFIWDQQSTYVLVAMTAPGAVFIVAIFLATIFHDFQ